MGQPGEYIPYGGEADLITKLVHRRSVSIVGERRSGLRTLAGHLLGELTRSATPKNDPPLVIPAIDGRKFQGKTDFLLELTERCLRERYGFRPPASLTTILARLHDRFDENRIVEFFEHLNGDRRQPVIAIYRFEHLAKRLGASALISIRDLIEKRAIQFLLLTRFPVAYLDQLTGGSTLAQSLDNVALGSVGDVATRRRFVTSTLDGLTIAEEALDYLGELSGGHRALLVELTEGAVERARAGGVARLDREHVEASVAYYSGRIQERLGEMFWPPSLGDHLFHGELEQEIQCAFELEYAPAWLTARTSPPLKRLLALGHVYGAEGGPATFASPLLLSLIRRRFITGGPRSLGIDCDVWLEHDEALRRLIRERLDRPVDQLLAAAGPRFAPVLEQWQLDLGRWGKAAGPDVLSYVLADGLYQLLAAMHPVAPAWLRARNAEIQLVSDARRPRTAVPWTRRGAEHELAVQALATLHREVCDQGEHDVAPKRQATPAASAPMPARQVRWLHISDVHFRGNRARGEDTVLRAFLETLADERKRDLPPERRLGPPPDMVLFTGDLAFSGQPEEYLQAAEFFDRLLTIVGLGRDRLFLVPGNHDVDRSATRYLVRTLSDLDSLYAAFNDSRWRRLYGERLTAHSEFCRHYFEGVPGRCAQTARGFTVPQPIRIREADVLLYLLNPQWCSSDDDDFGKLVLGVRPFIEDLQEDHGHADLRLALMHQPVHYLAEFDQIDFLPMLGSHIDVLLRGHLHQNERTRIISRTGDLLELSAGALFSDLKHAHENSAQLVEVDTASRSYTIHPIRYEPRSNRWVRDTSFGDAPSYTVTDRLAPRGGQR